jgi:hypothetical protein
LITAVLRDSFKFTVFSAPLVFATSLLLARNSGSIFGGALDDQTYQGVLTLAQILVGVLSLLVTFSFLFAQITLGRYSFVSTINEFYKASQIVLYFSLILYIILYTVGFIVFWKMIVVNNWYFCLDIYYLNSFISIPLIGIFVIAQLEALDLKKLLVLITGSITVSSILQYGLVEVKFSGEKVVGFQIKTYNVRAARFDPLRSFHEIMMTFIDPFNRLMIIDAFEILFSRICKLNRVRFNKDFAAPYDTSVPKIFIKLEHAFNSCLPSLPEDKQVSICIHIMHYVIRRCKNFITEVGQKNTDRILDSLRQNIVRLLCILAYSLSEKNRTRKQVPIILVSIYYVQRILFRLTPSLVYDTLSDVFVLSQFLNRKGWISESRLCIAILIKLLNDDRLDVKRFQDEHIDNFAVDSVRNLFIDSKLGRPVGYDEYDKYKDSLENIDPYIIWKEFEV